MSEGLPFFLTWLVTWVVLLVYLWRLESKLRSLQ